MGQFCVTPMKTTISPASPNKKSTPDVSEDKDFQSDASGILSVGPSEEKENYLPSPIKKPCLEVSEKIHPDIQSGME